MSIGQYPRIAMNAVPGPTFLESICRSLISVAILPPERADLHLNIICPVKRASFINLIQAAPFCCLLIANPGQAIVH
jgi:hypothetical protein